jgi:REP element-mobilizing transposase RayT
MHRRHRVQYANALYHVTSRGVRRGDLYLDDVDRQGFLDRIGETVSKFGWLIYAFVLMTNHFHLFFRTPQPNLCRGMQGLLGGYARSFNRRHGYSGHVLEARYRCGVIEDETYAWTVSRYVHLNPDGVLVEHPLQWPWSSYPGYVDPRQRWPWVQYDAFLNAWQGTWGGNPSQGYRQFVESALGQTCRSPFENAADGWILGGEGFIRRIREMISPPSRQPSVLKARVVPPVTLPQIVATTCAACDIAPEQLQIKGSRHEARYLIALLARQHSGAPLRELARVLGLQRADSVTTLLRSAQRAPASADFRRLAEEIRQRLHLR